MAKPLKVWNGSEWVEVAAQLVDTDQFLTTATASGTYVANSVFANKGTIAAASAASTPAALSVGSNGQMLMADSSATAGLRYVDPPANRNLVINGAMQVAQRGTSSTGIVNDGYFTADRWYVEINNTPNAGTYTQSVENDAPSGSGLRKSLKMLVSTANATLDAADECHILTKLEGQDLQRIKKGTASAEQLTLSFWVKSNVTGTYIAELGDSDNTRAVSASYSVNSANTWERKVITFPADTTGALNNDNGTSLFVLFALVAGSNTTSGTLATSWAAISGPNRYVGQVNLSAATNNYWQVTGVQLEASPVATPFEFEPYEATLRKCQRYYYVHVSGNQKFVMHGGYRTSTAVWGSVNFPTTMRTAPTLVVTTGTDYYIMSVSAPVDGLNSLTILLPTENGANLYNSSEASGTQGHSGPVYTNNASASVAFSSEL